MTSVVKNSKPDSQAIALAKSVVAWWEEAQFMTTSNGESEFNVFDFEPECVTLAKNILRDAGFDTVKLTS